MPKTTFFRIMNFSADHERYTPSDLYEHKEYILLRVLGALIKACGHEVELVRNNSIPFARDTCFILEPEKIALLPNMQNRKRLKKEQTYLIDALHKAGYQVVQMQSYFEGGNIVRIGNVLFHGRQCVGKYGLTEDTLKCRDAFVEEFNRLCSGNNIFSVYPLKAEHLELNDRIKDTFQKYITLPVCDEDKNYEYFSRYPGKNEEAVGKALILYYFHLDCMIASIPGSVITLTSRLFSMQSWSALRQAAAASGIRVIDLNYPRYFINPVMLNLLHIPIGPNCQHTLLGKKAMLVAPRLPESLEQGLRVLEAEGYILVTPRSLDKTDAKLHRQVIDAIEVDRLLERKYQSYVSFFDFPIGLFGSLYDEAVSNKEALNLSFNNYMMIRDFILTYLSLTNRIYDLLQNLPLQSMNTVSDEEKNRKKVAFLREIVEEIMNDVSLRIDLDQITGKESFNQTLPMQERTPYDFITKFGGPHCIFLELET